VDVPEGTMTAGHLATVLGREDPDAPVVIVCRAGEDAFGVLAVEGVRDVGGDVAGIHRPVFALRGGAVQVLEHETHVPRPFGFLMPDDKVEA
jgi:hypothetical protein